VGKIQRAICSLFIYGNLVALDVFGYVSECIFDFMGSWTWKIIIFFIRDSSFFTESVKGSVGFQFYIVIAGCRDGRSGGIGSLGISDSG